MTDLEHRILPNLVTVPGIVCGFVFSLFLPPGWVASLLGILIGGGGLWAIAELYYRVRGEDGMGMGDVKMLGMVGAFLGWQLAVLTLVLSSLLGSIVGVLMIAAGQGGMKYALPFGSFLAVAALWAGLTGRRDDRLVSLLLLIPPAPIPSVLPSGPSPRSFCPAVGWMPARPVQCLGTPRRRSGRPSPPRRRRRRALTGSDRGLQVPERRRRTCEGEAAVLATVSRP